MLSLRSGQIKLALLSFVFLTCALVANGQGRGNTSANPNFNKFQQKPFYYGIALGYNSAFFNVNQSRSFITNPDYNVVESINGPGFSIGVIGNLKLGRHFDLRSLVNFSFSSRELTYLPINSTFPESEKLASTFVEVPFLFRFKSSPYKDKRVFIVTGFKYSFDASNKANVNTDAFDLNISPHDFQYEIGAGIQFFLPFFILSPELKFSQGLGNILIYDQDTSKSRILDRILSRTISFSLNFEG